MGLKHLEDVTYFRLNNEINRPVNGQIMLHKDKEALDAFFRENVVPNTMVFDSIKDFINQYHIDLNFSETQSAARMVSRFFVDIRPYLEDKKIISSLMNMIISQMNYYLLIFRSLHLSRIAMVMLEDFMKC